MASPASKTTKTARKRRRPVPAKRSRQRRIGHIELIRLLLAVAAATSVLLGSGLAWFLSLDIPEIRSINDYHPLVATELVDRRGRPIDAIGIEYRLPVTYQQLPALLPQAFVAAEDSRYWEHSGVDGWSILRAAVNNLRSGRRSQGGSTITQQVTRALMLSREKTYFRKFTEAILSYRLNKMLTKEEILQIYLNEIYLGQGAYGVEAASRTYFGKNASRLTLAEAALLAGLPQSPSRYAPFKKPKAAKARQRYVLNRLAEEGLISTAEARAAYSQELSYSRRKHLTRASGYFAQYVQKELAAVYGKETLFHQGLQVNTTLDTRLQEQAARALIRGTTTVELRQGAPSPQGALVALDTGSGRIRAMVGGTDFSTSPFNRAVNALRQPGSVFKPLVFAAALDQGFTPASTIDDSRVVFTDKDGHTWQPKNHDGRFHGPTRLDDALIHSRNVVAVKLLRQVGIQPVIALARRAGINAELRPELPLALGSSPVSLLELTGAYTAFANRGIFHRPVAIISVRDRHGRVRPWPQAKPTRVMQTSTAERIRAVLARAIKEGTGKRARGIPGSAGKTGTSNNNIDAWFIGFTEDLTTGVWLGHDRNRSLGKGENGGRAAAPVWKTFMEAAR